MASSKFNPSAGSVKHFSDQANSLPVAILGMRCFGQALSGKLVVDGIEVLCVDHREKVIQELLSALGHMVTTDTITLEVLKQLGADKAEHVVIAIDSDTGASLLTASVLADMGVPLIRAKANNRTHAKILNQIGVHHTIRPGADISHRIAHLIGSKIQDFLEFDYDYAVGKATPPVHCPDKTVAGINQSTPITTVAVQKRGQHFHPALAGDHITTGGLLIVSGTTRQSETLTGE